MRPNCGQPGCWLLAVGSVANAQTVSSFLTEAEHKRKAMPTEQQSTLRKVEKDLGHKKNYLVEIGDLSKLLVDGTLSFTLPGRKGRYLPTKFGNDHAKQTVTNYPLRLWRCIL